MKVLDFSTQLHLPISCGTLVLNSRGKILLCHVTGPDLWDLPKGMQEPGEPALDTAQRELREETGLVFRKVDFTEVGCFDFRPDKRLHLFKVHKLQSDDRVAAMVCHSQFVDKLTGIQMPEMDGFCWATRSDVRALCGPNLQRVLLSLDW